MATRQQIQIAQDIIRFVNITNDMLDSISYVFRGVNPRTGGPLVDDSTGQPFDLSAIKTKAGKTRDAILGYWSMIEDFRVAYGTAALADALNAFGVSATVVKADIDAIKGVINYCSAQMPSVVDLAGLIPLADYIDVNIDKLPLVRRSWNIGL